MTEPNKTDHWNSLLDEIGLPASEVRPTAPKTAATTPSSAAASPAPMPPKARAKAEPKPKAAPAKRSSWNSLLGALGLAAPEEPAPPENVPDEPAAIEPPRPRTVEPPRPRTVEPPRPRTIEAAEPSEREERPERKERSGGHLLDEFKPRYKPEEPPFPSSRRREVVDDVALDIDLDADFAGEQRSEAPELDIEPSGEMTENPQARRDESEGDERGGRRRRRRRGRRRDEKRETDQDAPPRDPQRKANEDLSSSEEVNFTLDLEAEPPLEELDEELIPRREEPPASESGDERGRPRRRRRGRGGRERDRDETRPGAEGRSSRRPERAELPERQPREERQQRDIEARSRAAEDDDPIETMDDLGDDEESGGEHSVHKKIPTWAETVGILVDANIAARSSRQPDRGRPRRPRRGDR